MMLGQTLKQAREEHDVSQSEAAAATRIKIQHIAALESEEFETIAAPAYAKGFIKLYAEYLEMDPEPLIQDYEDRFMPKTRQPLMGDDDSQHNRSHDGAHQDRGRGWASGLSSIEWPFTFSKQTAGIAAGIAIGVTLVLFIALRLVHGKTDPENPLTESPAEGVERPHKHLRTHALSAEPPAPYLDLIDSTVN